MVLLDRACATMVKPLLETMVRVTMMRGAQSAGLVTYTAKAKGERHRVVNGKRTDLCTLLLRKVDNLLRPDQLRPPQLFQARLRSSALDPRIPASRPCSRPSCLGVWERYLQRPQMYV